MKIGLILRTGQQKFKVSLAHLVVSESKDMHKEGWGHVDRIQKPPDI